MTITDKPCSFGIRSAVPHPQAQSLAVKTKRDILSSANSKDILVQGAGDVSLFAPSPAEIRLQMGHKRKDQKERQRGEDTEFLVSYLNVWKRLRIWALAPWRSRKSWLWLREPELPRNNVRCRWPSAERWPVPTWRGETKLPGSCCFPPELWASSREAFSDPPRALGDLWLCFGRRRRYCFPSGTSELKWGLERRPEQTARGDGDIS